ncbi:hypothetical protein [Williamsia maris]|uniref:Sap-like sulfolipid-1-addressing protein n=1 Tax=Williamsia maris TaxID=72806 RepID=A0ABT1HD09_9NOCA|nr:hypothetical protein [Williamsia maris]MCP2176142.1 Protein of unknown function (DUF2910) [Williamsia maris]
MNSILAIVPLAAVDSINVLALLAVSYVWVSAPSRGAYVRTAGAFVVGGVCGLAITLAFSFTVILGLVHRAIDAFPPTAIAVIALVIAVVVFGMAVQGFRRPPTSLPVQRTVRPLGAFALGLLTWAIQSLTSAPFYGAIAVMADDGTVVRVVVSVVFVLIALVPVTSLLLALTLFPQETGQRLLDRMQRALPIASRVVSVILMIGAVIAAVLAIDSLAG